MTYNIQIAASHGRNPQWKPELFNLGGVAGIIRAQNPDVVVLQEVDRNRSRSGYTDQARWLGEQLGYHFAFACAYSEEQKNGTVGEYGNALLSRFPIADFQVHNLWHRETPHPDEPRWVVEPRCCYVARLQAEQPVCLMGLHLSTTADQRQRQLEQVADLITDNQGLRTVLMGDFNAEHAELNDTRLARLLHNILQQNPVATYPNGIQARHCIDHVWISPEWKVETVWVVSERQSISDHNPIVADLV